jgi:hypothetical protein
MVAFFKPKHVLSLSLNMRWKESIYCAFLGLAHFVYTLIFPSIINGERFAWSGTTWLEPSYIHAFFLSRLKFGEFARRPITTFLIQTLQDAGVSLEFAFLLVLYSGLIISFFRLFKLSLVLTQNIKAAYLSTFIFATSFWVIHAFFAEIYAYDEPWQYVFVFSSFLFLHRERWGWFSLFFLFALIARESTLLLLPGIFLFFMVSTPLWSRANAMRILKVLWTLPAYGLFLFWFIKDNGLEEKSSSYMDDVRFKHLFYSFETMDLGIDTLTSLAMSVAVAGVLLVLRKRAGDDFKDSPWVWAFALNFGINAFITLTLTMGRETRIFAQPVLMLSPFLGWYALKGFKSLGFAYPKAFRSYDHAVKWFSTFLLISAVCFAISLFAYEIYWPTDTKFFEGFQNQVYITFSLCAVILFLASKSKISESSATLDRLPGLLLFVPILFFIGNQHGYRAMDVFSPVQNELQAQTAAGGEMPVVIVGTTMPNAAENYFDSQEATSLAGDFNFQLPVKQFLYRADKMREKDLAYIELEPAINFPFRFILSQYGRAEEVRIAGYSSMLVHTDEDRTIEPYTFSFSSDSARFVESSARTNHEVQSFNDEYSVAFKMKLSDLGVDSLESIAAKVDFLVDITSEAAIVITVDQIAGDPIWQHEFLNVYLTRINDWNTAYKAIQIDQVTNPDTEIAVYVWNPKGEEISIRALEVALNTKWINRADNR